MNSECLPYAYKTYHAIHFIAKIDKKHLEGLTDPQLQLHGQYIREISLIDPLFRVVSVRER